MDFLVGGKLYKNEFSLVFILEYMIMTGIKCCKVDRYSEKYRPIFRSNPLYCEDCNGDLVGRKSFENGEALYFLECENCHKRLRVKS